jgi:hypothetical protein
MKRESHTDVIRRVARRPHLEAPPELPADERRLVAAVEQALRARARRRALVRRGGGLAFAAAAALGLFAGTRAWRGWLAPSDVDALGVAAASAGAARGARALTVLEAGGTAAVGAGARGPVALEAGMTIGVGLTLRAPASGEVRVGTANGTSLALEAGGELTVVESGATRRFGLRGGAVSARVERLFAADRFIVDTRDAEVEARGGSFRVAVVPGVATCGGGSTTRVSALEGSVTVRAGGREVSVPAGGAWPAGCDVTLAQADGVAVARSSSARAHAHGARTAVAALASAPIATKLPMSAPMPAPTAPAEAPSPAPAAAPPPAAPPPVPASSLGAENDLFAAAVRAKKLGRPDEAARLFGELAAAHPASPLVESALVQRMKLLATLDPAAAARAAAAYLERFPSGFARPEAQALTGRAAP